MMLHNLLESGCDLIHGLVPGDALKLASHTFQGILKPICVVLVVRDVQPFAADVALASCVLFIPLDLDDAVALDLHFKAAVLGTKDTAGFACYSHSFLLV